jgi:hypothetical protein
MAYNTVADEILMNHPAYENDDRIGNRWFQGRYRPGIREWGYPIRLPSDQWGPVAKMRGGFDERATSNFKRTLNEQTDERSSGNDRVRKES